jgi:hypothetical protein
MTAPSPVRASISVSLPTALIGQIDALAGEFKRSRSNMITVLLEQALNPVASMTTSSQPAVATQEPDVDCESLGGHIVVRSKTGSGQIGCSRCKKVKVGNNWVARA